MCSHPHRIRFFNTFLYGIKEQLIERNPQTIGFTETGIDTHSIVHPDDVRHILKEDGIELDYEVKLIGLPIEAVIPGMQRTVQTMGVSQSDYNELASRLHMSLVEAAYGHSWFVYPYIEIKRILSSLASSLA